MSAEKNSNAAHSLLLSVFTFFSPPGSLSVVCSGLNTATNRTQRHHLDTKNGPKSMHWKCTRKKKTKILIHLRPLLLVPLHPFIVLLQFVRCQSHTRTHDRHERCTWPPPSLRGLCALGFFLNRLMGAFFQWKHFLQRRCNLCSSADTM